MPDGLAHAATVTDYISGTQVRATPEEVDAVQVLAKRLVEDYGYPREHVQTHPQFRVRKRPSDEAKAYPIDVAVFSSDSHLEEHLAIVSECKRRTRRDGMAQLKLYLEMSPAQIGIWFNGEDHAYLRKVVNPNGERTFEELPNIPRFGQRIEDVGLYRRCDLKKPSNLRAVFRDLRNHLAGNVAGITRDEALAQEMVNLLFCKIYDETNTGWTDMVTFRSGHGESPDVVWDRIVSLFSHVQDEYRDVFDETDAIGFDPASLVYVVGELQTYCVTEADRDAVGDAFEVFIGPALRGTEGQFFTPRNVVRMVVDMLDPQPGEMLLDPACGSGGFLIMALEHVWQQIEAEGAEKRWSSVQIDRRKRDVATRCFRGIDKDSFLAKVTKAYMAIIGDGRGGVFCESSLTPPDDWHHPARAAIQLETFDVVLTNPPFGSKIRVKGNRVLAQYHLAHKWKRLKDGRFETTGTYVRDQAPQILFLERCLQLLKPGGRLGIVLPESVLGNPSYEYVLAWLQSNARIRAVVTLPEPLFKTSGKGGTHTKTCVLILEKHLPGETTGDYGMFMADAKWCGHDSRGNPTYRRQDDGTELLLDDVPTIAERFQAWRRGNVEAHLRAAHLGFALSSTSINKRILVPKYYDPELKRRLTELKSTHTLLSIGELIERGVVSVSTGVEVGKMAYGTGTIPFIRTSDLSNWELKADPKQGVSEEVYADFAKKVDVRAGDVLLVRDGTYLIGTSAMVTEADGRMLVQSHIYKLRVRGSGAIDRWLLFACLNTPIVRWQIRSKQFTQDIIDTLGARLNEVLLPIPNDPTKCAEISEATRRIIEARATLRNEAVKVSRAVEGALSADEIAWQSVDQVEAGSDRQLA